MKTQLEAVIETVVADIFGENVSIELTRPDEQFGDFATNISLQLAARLGQNPRQVAEMLVAKLNQDLNDLVSEVAIAGPGFINLKLTDAALIAATKVGPAPVLAGQVSIVEYSDPNPFKPLHAGHLYTTLVGDVIARLLEVAGAGVTRINYGGDVGLHVGKTMWAIIRAFNGEEPEKLASVAHERRADWLGERYVEGNFAYEDDEAAKSEITAVNKRVYEVHSSNDRQSAFAQIYWTCRQWSYDYFTSLYQQLQVHPFDRVIPESEIVPLGLQIVRQQLEAGVYKASQGAVVFEGEQHGLHTRVFINSAGLPTYETKDVGLLMTKWRDYHFDRSIVITANEQAAYMAVMLKSVEQFDPEPARRSAHLTHGMVKLQGGVKMSSRKGNTVGALDIIDAAAVANKTLTAKDSPETVLGAVKYAFLKNRIGGDLTYDPVESVSLEGNSGPYLQYAHARARSILRKSVVEPTEVSKLQAGERSLVRKLGEYSEVVDRAVSELTPHHICTYLYELAQTFNRFYENNRVIDDPREAQRKSLVAQYADSLKSGLQILGISAPEEM